MADAFILLIPVEAVFRMVYYLIYIDSSDIDIFYEIKNIVYISKKMCYSIDRSLGDKRIPVSQIAVK